MHQAYWSEPLPLCSSYPRGVSRIAQVGVTIGVLLMISCSTLLSPYDMRTQGTSSLLPWISMGLLVGGIIVICLSLLLNPLVTKQKWKRAFLKNNADLHLDIKAISKVVHYIRTETSYLCSGFEDIAINLACMLREANPYNSSWHTTFTWEVLHAYQFFSTGKGSLMPTRCPKRS